MNLTLRRIFDTPDHTIGVMRAGRHVFSTMEDAYNQPKIPGKTRGPCGTYEIGLRTVSPMASRYSQRFGHSHKGMLWLKNVPNFDFVYIHVGNDEDDTEGCILIGRTAALEDGFVGESVKAYRELFPMVMEALERDEPVNITITDQFS